MLFVACRLLRDVTCLLFACWWVAVCWSLFEVCCSLLLWFLLLVLVVVAVAVGVVVLLLLQMFVACCI